MKDLLMDLDVLLKEYKSVGECYKQGVYVSDKGYLDVNFDKEYEISKRLNPNSIYWVDDIGEMLELLDEED